MPGGGGGGAISPPNCGGLSNPIGGAGGVLISSSDILASPLVTLGFSPIV
ncbi:MAG: Uncharacterised protein [Methanobacteriota archaeon]|nr:MAG: Uncharacterised protein [Euryarchaeota archaeon]